MLCSGNQKGKTGNRQELKDAIVPGCDVFQTQGSWELGLYTLCTRGIRVDHAEDLAKIFRRDESLGNALNSEPTNIQPTANSTIDK